MANHWRLGFGIILLLEGTLAFGCTRTPRSAPPFQIGLANTDLQKTSDCVVSGLKKSVSDPMVAMSVKIVDPGKIEEITGTSADAAELYVIRLTAENDGTKAEAFSVIGWSKFKEGDVRSALSHCVAKLEKGSEGRGSFREDRKHAVGNSLH